MTSETPAVRRAKQYEEWCRVQFEAAHHDIWWVKGQQMQTAYWTLLLLSALVVVSELITGPMYKPTTTEKWLLSGLSLIAVLLGTYYTWDLYITLVNSRQRARENVTRFPDPAGVFVPSKKDPKRHRGFPVALTLVFGLAWGVTLRLFFVYWPWWFFPPLVLVIAGSILGLYFVSKVTV